MTTPIYDLTDWAAEQESPWIAHNLALRALEAVGRAAVADRDLTAPPGSCADGDAYLVDTPATGLWAGHDGEMAVAVGANAAEGWIFLTIAVVGQLLYVEDESARIEFSDITSPPSWVPWVIEAANQPEIMQVLVTDPNGDALTTGDGKAYFSIPDRLDGWVLTKVEGALTTTSSSGNVQTMVRNVTGAADMLSTIITIEAGELHSKDATTQPAIDGAEAAVAYGDLIRIDIDAAGTDAKGLIVTCVFEEP